LLQARVARASFDSMGCLHSGQWSGLFGDVTEHHRLLHGARRVTSCRSSSIAMQPETLARGSPHGTGRQRLADKITAPSNSPISKLHLKTKPRGEFMSSTVTNPVSNKCAHPACSCPVSAGEQYCSTACADSARQGTTQAQGGSCGCNHDACALAA
jgi:hypothetical protein